MQTPSVKSSTAGHYKPYKPKPCSQPHPGHTCSTSTSVYCLAWLQGVQLAGIRCPSLLLPSSSHPLFTLQHVKDQSLARPFTFWACWRCSPVPSPPSSSTLSRYMSSGWGGEVGTAARKVPSLSSPSHAAKGALLR